MRVSTHSRAEAAAKSYEVVLSVILFQHTAARRRLQEDLLMHLQLDNVSTHSRAEAAASDLDFERAYHNGFNTQPRGGGC